MDLQLRVFLVGNRRRRLGEGAVEVDARWCRHQPQRVFARSVADYIPVIGQGGEQQLFVVIGEILPDGAGLRRCALPAVEGCRRMPKEAWAAILPCRAQKCGALRGVGHVCGSSAEYALMRLLGKPFDSRTGFPLKWRE